MERLPKFPKAAGRLVLVHAGWGLTIWQNLDFRRHSLIFLDLKQGLIFESLPRFGSDLVQSVFISLPMCRRCMLARLTTCLESIISALFLRFFFACYPKPVRDLKLLLGGSSKTFSFHFNHVLLVVAHHKQQFIFIVLPSLLFLLRCRRTLLICLLHSPTCTVPLCCSSRIPCTSQYVYFASDLIEILYKNLPKCCFLLL